MIEALPIHTEGVEAWRVGAPAAPFQALLNTGVSADDITSSADYFETSDITFESYVAWVFERGQRREVTRFTDGTLRVLYTALEVETAISERLHWVQDSTDEVHLQELSVDFRGPYKDLRELTPRPTWLTGERADGAYAQCFAAARAAEAEGVDALMTPSARKIDGTCFPIIGRRSIAALRPGGLLVYVRSDETGWISRV